MEDKDKKGLDKSRIERYIEKLEHLKKLLDKLYDWTDNLEINEFLNLNLKEQFGIYHASQIIIEIITDIIAMNVKDLKIKPKDDYSNTECLEDQGLITNDLALSLKKLNGLRNILIHDYN